MLKLTPLEAWILLLICSLIPTLCIYLVLGKVLQQNFATLRGKIAGLAVELGGPVAFYAILLMLGKAYIPSPHEEIILKGSVQDVDGQHKNDYLISAVSLEPANREGQFTIKAHRDSKNTYSFLVVKNEMRWLREDVLVEDATKIVLDGFPDEKVTKIIEEDPPQDQEGQPLYGSFLEIVQIVDPRRARLEEGRKLEFNIQHGKYRAIVRDAQGSVRAEQTLTEVGLGGRHPLPKIFYPRE